MGMGIALYFGLASEPPVWVGAAGLGLVLAALLWLWRRLPGDQFRGCGPALLGLAVLLSGFAVASLLRGGGLAAGGDAGGVSHRGDGEDRGEGGDDADGAIGETLVRHYVLLR